MAAAQLTPGAVETISEHADGNGTLRPVLQVMDVRLVTNARNPSAAERFRMVLSDGVHTLQSMLATAENARVKEGAIVRGTIVHLQEFTCSTIQNRRIIIIIKLDILQSECAIIGNPQPYASRNLPKDQCPNLPAPAAQTYGGTYSGGPGALGSSVAQSAAQVANNVPHGGGGSYPGLQGTVAAPVDRAVEPVPNVSYGGSYGTMSAHPVDQTAETVPNVPYSGSYGTMSGHSTMNANMVQSKSLQPPLNSHQNQRFAAPATAGNIGPPGNAYGRPARPPFQQAPPMYMNRGPATKNDATGRVIPLAQLNQYQGRWTIKARVTVKTDVRHYNNQRGPGKVFSFDLLDKHGGEIRVTCFNAQVDLFYDQIEVGKVYLISRGNLKPAGKKYNPLNHEYEITLDQNTTIQICPDDDSIPRQQYNFRQIIEIESMETGATIDLVGVVTSVSPSGPIMRKDGTEVQKQNLQLKDMSCRSVDITFWGKFCDAEGQQLQLECDSGLIPILALKNVRVTEFNGRSLSTIAATQLQINPEFPEAEHLRRWYVTEGKTAAFVSLSREKASMGRTDVRKTVAQIKDENLGGQGKPEWITIKGAVSHLKLDNFFYPACTIEVSGKQCLKKVTNNGDGTWYCEKCDKTSPSCEYRYLLMCQIQDHTGVTYATAFQEGGTEIIGCSAQELYTIKEEDEAKFAEVIQGIRFQMFLFKIRVMEETFNDESRIKCNIVKAERLDPSKESGYLLTEIDSMLLGDVGTPPKVQGTAVYSAGFNSGQSVPASNNAYAVNMGSGANQFGQQANTYGKVSTPISVTRNMQNCMACGASGHNAQNCPAGVFRQQPAASVASSYGSSHGDAMSDLCYKCHQPGHYANVCPGVADVPQPPAYRNSAASGGYNRQSYVGATDY